MRWQTEKTIDGQYALIYAHNYFTFNRNHQIQSVKDLFMRNAFVRSKKSV